MIIGLLILGLFGFGCATLAGYTTNEVYKCVLSPDTKNFGCVVEVVEDYKKFFMIYNGQKQKVYDYIDYIGSPVFSPDSKQYAYVAGYWGQNMNVNDIFVVMNNKELEKYNGIRSYSNVVFSPDSKHYAYIAINHFNFSSESVFDTENFVVFDGQEQTKYEEVDDFVFSPDSKQYAYYAKKSGSDKYFLVINGEEQAELYDQVARLIFSPDSKQLAYVAMNFSEDPKKYKEESELFVLLNGQKLTNYFSYVYYYNIYSAINNLKFSNDSQHFAYQLEDGRLIVLDGQEQPRYAEAGGFVFSPDSQQYAYYAKKDWDSKYFLVINGQEQADTYDSISSLAFSPDSKTLAYKVYDNNRGFVVINNVPQKEYDYIGPHGLDTNADMFNRFDSIVFSFDSKHYAYKAIKGGKSFVVLDKTEAGIADYVYDIKFSPDSQELVYVALINGNVVRQVVPFGQGFVSPQVITDSSDFAKKNVGKIFLQVESHGEAWYIWPKDAKRYYLKDGPTAYEALRKLGLGITNKDLALIPVGLAGIDTGQDSDNDGLSDNLEKALGTDPNNKDSDHDAYPDGTEVKGDYNPLGAGKMKFDTKTSQRLEGQILLQVEGKGEAWYVKGGKRYYMANGQDAYQIMRQLSIGITNADLGKITEGEL